MTMHLTEISVRNFGPYFGEQSLKFGEEQPIVVVHGENMRGKTSLLNAVRWSLYGRALNRFGKQMLLRDLVNWDASDSGDWTMSVKLGFSVDSSTFRLTRQIQAKDVTAKPRYDKDFEKNLFLERDGNFYTPEEAQVIINRLLPEQISRFFLFDGELLNEYETLLSDFDKQAQTVRESIESILGVPALQNTIADLKQNLKDATRRQGVLARQDRNAQVFGMQVERLGTQIETDERDVEQMTQQRDEMSAQQRELDDILRQTAAVEAEVERLRSLREKITLRRNEEEQLLTDRRSYLSKAWRDLVQPAVQDRMDVLQAELDEQMVVAERVGALRARLRDLSDLAESASCPVCEQPMVNVDRAAVKRQRIDLENELTKHSFDEQRVTELSQSLARLRKVRGSGAAATIRHIEERLSRIRGELADYETREEEITDQLKGHDEAAIARNRRDYDRLNKEIGVVEHAIKQKEESISKNRAEVARYRAEIRKVSGPHLDRLNREVQVYEELDALFRNAVALMRDDLRKTVERDASEIFRELTTDKSYTGLRINDYYGLTILDSRGEEVRVRAAGAEQVVALSLIGALNRNAVRHGPIIMDTPFGRLDRTHRGNILKFLPTLADQVTLLVQSGEVDRDRDLKHIKEKIDREYRIDYVTNRRSTLTTFKG